MAEQLYASSHITGNLANPTLALGAPDTLWAGVVNSNTSATSRYAISDPVDPLTGSAVQTVNVAARKGSNSGNPSVAVNLYENGVLVGVLVGSTAVTSATGQTLTGTFNTADVTDPADVEVEVVVTGTGGNPSTRNSAQINHIEWVADTSVAVSSGSAAGSVGWAGTVTGATVHSGTASGAVGWVGIVDGISPGITVPEGAASGTVGWTGTTTGAATRAGDATGSVLWAGSVSGGTIHQGNTAGSFGWSGSTTGTASRNGSAVASIIWDGSAQGSAPTVGVQEGSATGTIAWAGTTTGTAGHEGSVAGVLEWAGIAGGATIYQGTVSGMIDWVGSATSEIQPPPRHRLEAHTLGYGWEGSPT